MGARGTARVEPVGRAVCPVCWATARPTRNRNIAAHFDTSDETCPASGHPYYIVVHRGDQGRNHQVIR